LCEKTYFEEHFSINKNQLVMKKLHVALFLPLLLLSALACQPKKAPEKPAEEPGPALADGTYCYLGTIGRDSTTLKLVISGGAVSGDYHWNPYEKDGGYGTIAGTLEGNEIIAEWNYVIEGSNQIAEVRFQVQEGKVGVKSGERDLVGDKELFKDPAKLTIDEYLNKVDCQ
jgi:hypothetical protein